VFAAKQFPYDLFDYVRPNPNLIQSVSARQMSAKDATGKLRDAGISPVASSDGGGPVYLVTFAGKLAVRTSPTPEPIEPLTLGPAQTECQIAMAVVSPSGVRASGSATSTDCG
jgi:hypothetical protein